jgi:Predicted periplasmic ligand-binding sensor domain
MWISTPKGLKRIDPSTMKVTSFLHDPNDTTTPSGNNPGNKMVLDNNGNLWMFQSDTRKLDCFNTKTYHCKRFSNFVEGQSPIRTNFLLSLLIDKNGRLWVGTSQSGLCVFYPDKDLFYEYKVDPFDPAGLKSILLSQCTRIVQV